MGDYSFIVLYKGYKGMKVEKVNDMHHNDGN